MPAVGHLIPEGGGQGYIQLFREVGKDICSHSGIGGFQCGSPTMNGAYVPHLYSAGYGGIKADILSVDGGYRLHQCRVG